MKAKSWIIGWLLIVGIGFGIMAGVVYRVDPYFHYHAPLTDRYFYELYNQRSQNDGIIKHFDYDAIITGTSMTENFKTSEADEIFELISIKVCYSGATYKEIDDSLMVALENNSSVTVVIRGLDMNRFLSNKDEMRYDLGEYPTYLYDDNPFNDVKYLLNMEIISSHIYPMIQAREGEDFQPGITSFDEYSNWMRRYGLGINNVYPDGVGDLVPGEPIHLTEEEKQIIRENIEQNVISLAEQYPDVTFYYFFTPYSIGWWKEIYQSGKVYQQIEAEQYTIELILQCENIKLYSFNNRTDIITDFNNYRDTIHYAEWINSLMLQWMYDGEGLLTAENYQDYINAELEFFTTFDYSSINGQEDYENDYYAAALLNEELTGAVPMNLYGNNDMDLEDADLTNVQYEIENAEGYRYLVFYGRKLSDTVPATITVYDDIGEIATELTIMPEDVDGEWHQYVINLPQISGSCSIVFDGGAEQAEEGGFVFGNITLM